MGSWAAGTNEITIDLSELDEGTYNYTSVLDDGYENVVQDTVIVAIAFPTMLVYGVIVIAGVATVVVAGVGITIKRKKQRSTNKIKDLDLGEGADIFNRNFFTS